VDNDVRPAAAAGFRSIWIRRGPWGLIQAAPDDVSGVLEIGSLTELPDTLRD
jgi:FMN phosphatase YigB (HAD superfamily)